MHTLAVPKAALLLWTLTAASSAWAQPELETCRDRLALEGPSESASLCYFQLGWDNPDLLGGVRQELEQILERFPDAAWPHFYRGRLPPWWVDGMAYMRRAAELLEADGDVSGEIRARAHLVTLHGFEVVDGVASIEAGFAAADGELERLHALLEMSSLVEDRALVDLAEAHYRLFKGDDLGEAYSLLLDATEILEQAPPSYHADLKECYRSLIDVTKELGVPWGAEIWARKAEAAALAGGSLRDLAAASHNVIDATLGSTRPSEEIREQLVERLQETLEIAQRSGHAGSEALTRYLLATLEGGPQARGHLERCREIAEATRDAKLRSSCILALATLALDSDPDEARRLLEVAHPAEGFDRWTFLDGWPDQMRVLWQTASVEQALEHGQTVLDAIENLRRRQTGDAVELLLSQWADPYYWLAGRLLQDAPEPDSIRIAFALIERLRAQTLREALAVPDAHNRSAGSPDEGRKQLDRAYVEVYSRLLDPSLEPAERQTLRERLSELERLEAEFEPRYSDEVGLAPPPADLLDRVQAALASDEAMLSYQLGLWQGWDRRFLGGSWLTVVTPDTARAYPLTADATQLGSKVRALLRLDNPERPGALAGLYNDLLAPALAELPPEVRKLIVVPDGFLHLLPFALLRQSDLGPPLVDSFEIQTVPSATVWVDWRQGSRSAPEGPGQALVLANPRIASGGAPGRSRGALDAVSALGPLPYAEQEGRSVLRHMGGRGRLESGSGASEHFLKNIDLRSYDILHFAAHAISDPAKPGRSAIMLAPGANDEDGFLRPGEIARLRDLDGKLIVLAACDSARGNVLRGEGVLSLGRAFFEAGARAVVASLWRLDDRLATEFFDDFYDRLRLGKSVGAAFAETQRSWSTTGHPASVWAGLVLLGDGDFVPIPGGVEKSSSGHLTMASILLALLATMAAILARR